MCLLFLQRYIIKWNIKAFFSFFYIFGFIASENKKKYIHSQNERI